VNRTTAGSRLLPKWFRARKHSVLLVAIVGLQAAHPVLAHWSAHTRILGDTFFAAVAIGLFLIVFEQRWERWLAFGLVLPGLAANFTYHAFPGWMLSGVVVLYHCSAIAFLGFAVAVILRGVFRRETIRLDDILGAACGFLLTAMAWGNLYALVYVFTPESFSVPHDMAWQLSDWHTRRALFDYFSVVSLTGLGYGDITPRSPPMYALVALEVVFGLFYLAVVVAQLVGLMMVHRSGKKGSS
jgi:hypothetical protein